MFKSDGLKSLYIRNIVLTILFAVIVTIITSIVNYNIKYIEINEQIKKDVEFDSKKIKLSIKSYLDNIENTIDAILVNKIFTNYLQKNIEKDKKLVASLFESLMYSHKSLFQLRFIDKDGFEKVRIEKERNTNYIYAVPEELLQNKSSRYYFKKTIKNKEGSFYYSNLDLNVENKKIELPLRPTIRISTNVFYKGNFYGIIIANVEMDNLLSIIESNNNFNIYLVDNEGNFIIHPEKGKRWNKYLSNGHTVFSEFNSSNTLEAINTQTDRFIFPLKSYFKNEEEIKLILEAENEYVNNVKNSNLKYLIILASSILIISIVLGFIISIPISKIYLNFNKLYKDNLRFMDIIDKYVITMNVGLDKKIISVSTALSKISGYKKDELIGKEPSILKSDDTSAELYKNLWNNISNGLVWEGELKDKGKDGTFYWLKSIILPNFNDNKKITSFTSISENITDKKVIEELSQTDKLTQLANRFMLDKSLEIEFERYKRTGRPFSILLIDIDKFKEVNDTYGHQVGDVVLIELSKILKENSRKIDTVGRWGGEEFLIVCSNTKETGALSFAEKIRKEVELNTFTYVKNKTVSIGLAEINNNDTILTLLQRADQKLYLAKENGRNQVVS